MGMTCSIVYSGHLLFSLPAKRVLRWLQMTEDTAVMLNGFGTVVNSFKGRAKPYLPQICGTIKWRLNNKVLRVTCSQLLGAARLELLCCSCCSKGQRGVS